MEIPLPNLHILQTPKSSCCVKRGETIPISEKKKFIKSDKLLNLVSIERLNSVTIRKKGGEMNSRSLPRSEITSILEDWER